MTVDYDFTLGKQRFRGVGWRGLAADGLEAGPLMVTLAAAPLPAPSRW